MLATILQAGKLRHRIDIMQLTLAQDSFGGTVIDQESVFATVWASVEALSGRELYAAQQKVSEVTHLITIRYLDGVKARMNVWFQNRQFQIQAVENPDERPHFLRLLCIERDDSALEAGGTAP